MYSACRIARTKSPQLQSLNKNALDLILLQHVVTFSVSLSLERSLLILKRHTMETLGQMEFSK